MHFIHYKMKKKKNILKRVSINQFCRFKLVRTLLSYPLCLNLYAKYSYHVEIGQTTANGPEYGARLHRFDLRGQTESRKQFKPQSSFLTMYNST